MKIWIIKTFFSLLFLISSESGQLLFSQVTAGSVPTGASIINNVVDLNIIENEHDTTTYLDIDADGTQDIRIWFLKGYPPYDAPNLVAFYILNNSLSLCINSGLSGKTSLYELGDTLCTTGHEWGVDSFYIVGCYGGWTCTGDTTSINNKFIAYRKTITGEIGWIRVSMSLYSGVEPRTITFNINELLVLYLESGIIDLKDQITFDLAPNPTLDGRFEIQCSQGFSSIELFNSEGQLIKIFSMDGSDLYLPESKGLYLVKIRNEKGMYGSRKIIRL
jgi:hypothetical protein